MEALFTLLRLFILNFIFLLASASLWSVCPVEAAVPPPIRRGTSWPLAFLRPFTLGGHMQFHAHQMELKIRLRF